MGSISEEQISGGKPPSELELLRLEPDDVPAIKTIAADSFPTQWKAEDYRYFLQDQTSFCWGLFGPKRELRTYLLALNAGGDLDIVSVATHPSYRKQGLALYLLNQCFQKESFRVIALEVDTRNEPAIELYKKMGFKIIKRRVRYYEGKRDAYQMLLELDS